jgi:hypothetical protein
MLAHRVGLGRFMSYGGTLLKQFGQWAQDLSGQVRESSLKVAESLGRPVVHLPSSSICKESVAREIADRDKIRQGLIAVLTCVEPCGSYDIRSNKQSGRLELIHAPRKCQHLYHYFIHPVFGFMHVRLQTWLPFNQFICVNGREWLARQMDRSGIGYMRKENCFPWIGDIEGAQRLLDEQVSFHWSKALGELGLKVNPALPKIIRGYDIDYYWSLEESEWATDVMFRSAGTLSKLYPNLIRHGMEHLGSSDVMRFLGHRLPASGRVHPHFAGEIVSDIKTRSEGVRIKHRVNRNSVKMYNKQSSVLRVETTLNNMRDLKAPRKVKGKMVWRPMRKGVADIRRRAQVSQASNQRYLEAMSAVESTVSLKDLTGKLSRPIVWKKQPVRGMNLLGERDASLLKAVGRGEFLLNGFRNRDLQNLLFEAPATDAIEKRRRSGQVTRQLRMLRAHGLIRKVPKSHRYLVTPKGRTVITALAAAQQANITTLMKAA